MAFRERNHEAYSCDIIEPSGGHPEWHILGDALQIINPDGKNGIIFKTMTGAQHWIEKWDLIIAHPPCTYLTVAGNSWFNEERYGDKAIQRKRDRQEAIDFFMKFVNADCERIAVENPIGVMSTVYRKPDQIIQPYEYGYPARKATCLWLKNLPKLRPTNVVPYHIKIGNYSDGLAAAWAEDENGRKLRWNDPETAKQRSKTVIGIGQAMAEQWENQ